MSDIFREVEEDVRKERLAKFWKAYGDYVMALGAVFVLAFAGYQVWLRYENNQRAKVSSEFVAAQNIDTPAKAEVAFGTIAKSARGGYGLLAKLSQADAMPAAGKVTEAIALYKDIADADKGLIGAAARVRAAWLLADTTPRAYLETLLAPINTDTSAWRQMAREILAYSDYRAGKTKEAMAAFDALAKDPDSPDALRARTKVFADFLRGGGTANFGTVPAAVAAPAPGEIPGITPPAPATP